MKALLKRLVGSDRPKVIAVLGLTRDDIASGVTHARTAAQASGFPIRTWCAEDTNAETVRRELREVWPALILVSWNGLPGNAAFKLLPLTVPPFRVVVFNESRDFFPAHPLPLARHFSHLVWVRLRDGVSGLAQQAWSLLYRAGQKFRDVALLGWSLIYRFAKFCAASARLVFEALLAMLASIAPPTAGFFRGIYKRRPEGLVMPLDFDRPAGSTHIEVEINGRSWPRHDVKRLARMGTEDFIVFRKRGDTSSPEPLIEAALERNAFAVAKQLAWTGWRARIATKHPFRRLLPGEVAQVAMPFSTLMVVRRDLIARLGVPRAATFGAAMMLLFHRAARMGWPSLVAGHAEPITQEPAMPLEDAEFVLRSIGGKRYESDLARGNVVSAPHFSRGFRGLPRVLVVSPYLPFPLSHGGAVRMYNLCRSLAGEVDFILVCFREADETVRYPELHEMFREVYSVDIDEKNTDPEVPKQVVHYRNSAMCALIRDICVAREIDLVQLEYTQMAEYRGCTGGRPTLLVEHDITFTLHHQLAGTLPGPEPRRQYELWVQFENAALKAADAVWTMSERDRALAIEHGARAESTVSVPNGVDLVRFRPEERETEGPAILLVGSFRHLPNLMAYEALRQTIMPAVWEEFPDCRLNVIAGPDHERWARLAGKSKLLAPDARVKIHGFVEDVRPAYRECDVVTIPLPVSAGTNIKLMEAMACGRAIVSTPVGCQGLELKEGADLLVSGIGPGFIEAVCRLLRDAALRSGMAARARRTAEARFNWDIIARDALACYQALLGRDSVQTRLEITRCSFQEEPSDAWLLPRSRN